MQTEFNASRLAEFIPSMAQSLFDEYDADKNGIVTKEKEDFTLMESASDTKVTKKEMILSFKTQYVERLDSNSDGCVTQQEYQKSKFPFE